MLTLTVSNILTPRYFTVENKVVKKTIEI